MRGSLRATGDYHYGTKIPVIGSLISVALTFFIPNSSISSLTIKQKDNEDTTTTESPKSLGII